MGKASRGKKASINEVPNNQRRYGKKLDPAAESPSKVGLQKAASSIIEYIPIFIVLFVSFAVYFNAIANSFVYDDLVGILNNPWIRDIKHIPDIFSSNLWGFSGGSSNYYRPVASAFGVLQFKISGTSPVGYHLINVLFHSAISVLVLLIVSRLVAGSPESRPFSLLSPALIAALLFAVHPIHTEAVAWIGGFTEISFTFFYLLSLYFYIRAGNGQRKGYLCSVFLFAVSVLCKETALTFPVLIVVYDYTFRRADFRSFDSLKRYIPYVVVSGVYFLVRYYVLRGFAPIASYSALSNYQLIVNVFPLFKNYLTSLIWPFDLNFWHTFHPINSLFGADGMISLVVAVLFFIFTIAAYRRDRLLFFSLLLLVIPLLPAFYMRGIIGKPFAERYLYLPSVGYLLLQAIFISWAREKLPRAVRSITIVFIVIMGAFTVGTINRNTVWQNSLNLWSDTVKKSPDSAEAHHNLGISYAYQGLWDTAIAELQTALRLQPDNAAAHNNLGIAYKSQGQMNKAIAEFQTTLRLRPDLYEARQRLDAIVSRRH